MILQVRSLFRAFAAVAKNLARCAATEVGIEDMDVG